MWSTQSKALASQWSRCFSWNSLVFSLIQWMLAIWSLICLPFVIFSNLPFFFSLLFFLKPLPSVVEKLYIYIYTYTHSHTHTHTHTIYVEKTMATHSSTLAWKIPWTEEPGRLQSMTSLRVRHDWVTSLSLFTFMHWRRKWQPIPVFFPGESQGWGSLVGCCLWGRSESDTTEAT